MNIQTLQKHVNEQAMIIITCKIKHSNDDYNRYIVNRNDNYKLQIITQF